MEFYNINYNRNEIDEATREVFFQTLRSMDEFSLEDIYGYAND